MLAMVVGLAISCGSKEAKEETATTDSIVSETPEVQMPVPVKEQITGVWVIDGIDYTSGLNAAEDKEAYKAQLEKVLAQMKGKSILDLGADGRVTLEMMDHTNTVKNYTGTWSLIDRDGTLNIMPEGAPDPLQWTILEVTENNLSLLINSTTMKFVPKK